MATTYPTDVRTADDRLDAHGVLLALAFAGQILVTVAATTGAAIVLAGFTGGLGQFVLVAAGWLVVVSASPELAKRGTKRLDGMQLGQRAPRTSRAVHAIAAYFVAR